tara:strand:+ start:70 stop:789 length:720 start_codon:yes stop_codon:yes gene_type:complete
MDLMNVIEQRGYFDRANRFVPKPYYSLNEHKWQENLAAFIDYKKENPDVPVPQKAKYHGLNLGTWVNTQRSAYKQDTLSAERIERLEEAGIIWDAQEEAWQTHYQAFIGYKEENPDVPISFKAKYHGLNLGNWVDRQRTDYKKGTLSAERIELLEEAGIIWDAQEGAWQTHYQAFVDYQKENPGVPIPQRSQYHDYNLGWWVSDQRTAKNKKTLSDERINKLEEAGIIWSKRRRKSNAE